jgi:hypothetical protein
LDNPRVKIFRINRCFGLVGVSDSELLVIESLPKSNFRFGLELEVVSLLLLEMEGGGNCSGGILGGILRGGMFTFDSCSAGTIGRGVSLGVEVEFGEGGESEGGGEVS